MIDRTFDQIDPDDITSLCREGIYENQLLEFKRDLPAERGRPDPWLTGGDSTAYARDHLLREVIAFANAQGGTVIVGMDQTTDDPPRAAAICPIPRIHDLATRMENAARACIDPVLPGLQIRGIEVGGAVGEGVLLFRTGPSPAGPHRVAKDGHAYIRRTKSRHGRTRTECDTTAEVDMKTLIWTRGANHLRGHEAFATRITGMPRPVALTIPLSPFAAAEHMNDEEFATVRNVMRRKYARSATIGDDASRDSPPWDVDLPLPEKQQPAPMSP
jgi:hypothetical protein